MKHQRHRAHHLALFYPLELHERLYSYFIAPLLLVIAMMCAVALYPSLAPTGVEVSLSTILLGALYTCARLLVAYMFAVVIAIPLALFVQSSAFAERILLPVFDVLESVPILALFPVIIMLFIRFGDLNGAAIFILFLSMLWNIVFTVVGGLKIIPQDIMYAARVFGIKGFDLVRRVTLPAVVPQLVTGSILALAQGWNLIIVAEVLHTYIPGGTAAQDVFGIGSLLVSAAANAQNSVFVMCVFVMVVIIGLMNFFVWQRLLHYSQRFRFE
jgi:NitT/TauT family transport system permease protein